MLIIGESIAAGTTTALGVLKALGYEANEKVSGSMPHNPHDLKSNAVNEGLKNAGIAPGEADAMQAIGAVGDPTIPAIAGMVLGSDIPIILAGGTQMAATCAGIVGSPTAPIACIASASPGVIPAFSNPSFTAFDFKS